MAKGDLETHVGEFVVVFVMNRPRRKPIALALVVAGNIRAAERRRRREFEFRSRPLNAAGDAPRERNGLLVCSAL